MEMTLAALSGTWLRIECACKPVRVYYPLRHGEYRVLKEVMAKLRCERCRSAPSAVTLLDDPAAGMSGGNPRS